MYQKTLVVLFFLLSMSQQVVASGLMDIRLKSAHHQKATVLLSDGANTTNIALPIILQKNVELKFGDILIDFSKTYTVTILVDETDALGLNSSAYHGKLVPKRGTASPSELHLPLNGIRFDFKCDADWYGQKCSTHCEKTNATKECSAAKAENTSDIEMQFNVDYTVNPLKMETLLAMMRKENEVENAFRSHGPVLNKIEKSKEVDNGLLEKAKKSADEQLPEFLGGSGEFPEQLTLKFMQ